MKMASHMIITPNKKGNLNSKLKVMSNLGVSIQAFLQEIESWSISLSREAKKLKSFKPEVQNKFKLNSMDIVLTEIESLQIRYKKIKYKYKPFLTNHDQNFLSHQNQQIYSEELLIEYSQLSKSFMDVLQKVSLIQAETNQPNFLVQNASESEKIHQKTNNKSFPQKKHGEKTFLNDTFAFKTSKENKNYSNITKNKNNKSIFDKRTQNKDKQQNTSIRNKAQSLIGEPPKASQSLYNPKPKSFKNTQLKPSPLIAQDQDTSLWEIRHQLSKITQMMKEMKNEIKFHEHQETTKEINKIENKNRKIASELKSVKEENRVMLDKMDELRRQLMDEKKMQVDLINKFEKKSYLGNTALYDSRATHGQNYKSQNHDMSLQGKSPITNRKGQPIEKYF